MKKKIMTLKRYILITFLVCLLVFLTSCMTRKMKDYYSQESNYVNATGIVTHIAYDEDEPALYLGFSDLNPEFDDINFKIVGDNLSIVQENGIDEKVEIGDRIDFVSAPRYFGDGYVMPIVEISVNEEELLDFDKGFENLLNWLGD